MNTAELEKVAVDALNDLKAIDLVTYDVRGITDIADVMIICTGRSSRHAKSLAENVLVKAKEHKIQHIKMEGERQGEWVIVDLTDVVVHVMTPASRAFYHLEDLWEPIAQLRENQR